MTSPEPQDEAPRRRRRWLLWVIWIGRVELLLAALLGLAICVGRVFVRPDLHDLFWLLWRVLVAPSYLIGLALTLFVARAVKRSFEGTVGELAFWAVFPGCALALLAWLAPAQG
jgi:hypothetical protein